MASAKKAPARKPAKKTTAKKTGRETVQGKSKERIGGALEGENFVSAGEASARDGGQIVSPS